MIKNINRHSNAAEIEVNVHSNTNINGIDLANANVSFAVTFTANANANYILNGTHRGEFGTQTSLSNSNNGTIYVEKGDILSIVNGSGAHPIGIRTELGASNYTTGITGSGTGTLVWNTSTVVGDRSIFYYQCTSHPNAMYGQIIVKSSERGKFSFGVLTPSNGVTFVRNNPIAIGVTGNTVIAGEGLGISTFPVIQRRGFGIRNTGAIKRSHTP